MHYPAYIAHRGLYDEAAGIPENSLPAFENAVKNGFAIELDVRFTADRRAVVFHDPDTLRMCGEKLVISKTDYAGLQPLVLHGTDCRIPLLSQVLKLVNAKTPLFIELKYDRTVPDQVKRLAVLLRKYKGEYAVQSFDPFVLRAYREADGNAAIGQIVSKHTGKDRILREAVSVMPVMKIISKPDYLAWDLRSVTLDAVFDARELGAKFVTWTADTPELLEIASEFSDCVIFEKIPAEYLKSLRKKTTEKR